MRRILYIVISACLSLSAWAQQDTIYLDSNRIPVRKKAKAKECAIVRKTENGGKQVCFYTPDGKPTSISQYKKFGKTLHSQILHGATHYLFSDSEQDSLSVFYKDNCRSGGATFYYPSGKVMAKCQYKNGVLNGPLQQFYEDGKLKRAEVYKNNRSIGGKLLAQDSTELAFSAFYEAARPVAGESVLIQAICKAIRLPVELLKEMNRQEQYELSACLGVVVDAEGKAIDIVILSTQHPKFNKSCFPDVMEALSRYMFIPGKIDGRENTTVAMIEEPIIVKISSVTTTRTTTSYGPGNSSWRRQH